MPFSSITDSERLSVVMAAYERAWAAIEARKLHYLTDKERERERIADIVASLARTHPDGDLCRLAIEQFVATAVTLPPDGDH